MMAVDVKRLNDAAEIDLSRCEAKSDRRIAARRMDAALLAAASVDVAGERRWFALRTLGVRELALCESLVRSCVDAVVPIRSAPAARRFVGRSAKIVHKPVLKHLVFVRIVPSNEAFAGLRRVDGVAAFLGIGERPHPIGDREMNGFMDLAQAGAFDERNTPTGLKVGSRVRINVGAYADVEGVLAGYAGSRKARVLTWLFGGEMAVDVRLAHLSKLE